MGDEDDRSRPLRARRRPAHRGAGGAADRPPRAARRGARHVRHHRRLAHARGGFPPRHGAGRSSIRGALASPPPPDRARVLRRRRRRGRDGHAVSGRRRCVRREPAGRERGAHRGPRRRADRRQAEAADPCRSGRAPVWSDDRPRLRRGSREGAARRAGARRRSVRRRRRLRGAGREARRCPRHGRVQHGQRRARARAGGRPGDRLHPLDPARGRRHLRRDHRLRRKDEVHRLPRQALSDGAARVRRRCAARAVAVAGDALDGGPNGRVRRRPRFGRRSAAARRATRGGGDPDRRSATASR